MILLKVKPGEQVCSTQHTSCSLFVQRSLRLFLESDSFSFQKNKTFNVSVTNCCGSNLPYFSGAFKHVSLILSSSQCLNLDIREDLSPVSVCKLWRSALILRLLVHSQLKCFCTYYTCSAVFSRCQLFINVPVVYIWKGNFPAWWFLLFFISPIKTCITFSAACGQFLFIVNSGSEVHSQLSINTQNWPLVCLFQPEYFTYRQWQVVNTGR